MIEVKYLLLNLNTDRPVSLGASPLSHIFFIILSEEVLAVGTAFIGR
jgi:hypothetical protein